MATMSLSKPTVLLGQSCSFRCSSYCSGERLVVGKNIAGITKRSLVLRAQPVCKMQEGDELLLNVSPGKKVAVAAAAALLLNISAVNVATSYAAADSSTNPAKDILNSAKQAANDAFAQAQRTGAETVGEAASAARKTAPPALSQLDPSVEEASEPYADGVAARADIAADNAPGTSQQEGKGTNPIEKAFATPTRGLGDKLEETKSNLGMFTRDSKIDLPGQGTSIGQNPGLIDGVQDTLRDAAKTRDEGKVF